MTYGQDNLCVLHHGPILRQDPARRDVAVVWERKEIINRLLRQFVRLKTDQTESDILGASHEVGGA